MATKECDVEELDGEDGEAERSGGKCLRCLKMARKGKKHQDDSVGANHWFQSR
jgi:hypothetical protein